MTNLFTNLSKNGSEPVNGSRMDRHYTENGPMKSRQLFAVLAMLWVKLVNLVNFVMQIFKLTKLTEQIFEESLKSLKSLMQIFATYATSASANFVGKASNEGTVMYRVKSRIPSCYLRYSLDSNLSRFSLASLICLCMLTVGVGNVWGAVGDVTTLIDFTQTGNLGHSGYTDTWTISANTNSSGNVQCAVGYAVSNNEAKLRAGGGKSSNLTNQDCYIGTKSATSVPVSTFSVNVETVTSDANITINSVKLYVYSNSSWSTQVDCVERTSSYATGAVSFTPTSGTVWASGVYFKLVWNISTSATGSNHYTAINKLQITEGSTKTLSSIAKKTDATKTAYIEGEKFNPAGLVITATYSDKSTEDIAYTGNEAKFSFSPTTATALTTSNTSVTVTYGGQTCSQSINVYSITLQAKDEDGNDMGVGAPGAPTFNGSTGQITAAADAANYVFKEWVISNATASTTTASPSTLSSPTGAVTVTAKYYKPISVSWKVNGEDWTPSSGGGTDGTATVGYGTAWSTLTLPTDPIPGTDEDACGNKFIGWTTSEIDGELDKTDDAAAITTLNSNILNSSTKSGKTSTYITTTTTFHAVFADYAE